MYLIIIDKALFFILPVSYTVYVLLDYGLDVQLVRIVKEDI